MIIEKPFDYQTETLSLGAGITKFDGLRLDGDGDFVLRSIDMISTGDLFDTIRVRRADQSLIESNPVQFGAMFFGGYNINFQPVEPEELYPRFGVIEYEVVNVSGAPVTFTILFRGAKRVERADTCWYPPRFRARPFDLVRYDTMAAVETIRNRTVTVPYANDFVLRAITFSQDETLDTPGDLRFRFQDHSGWYYSNVPINWQFLVGTFVPEQPRAWVPEIYIPRREFFSYDAVRDKPAGSAMRGMLRFIGAIIEEAA